MKIELPDEQWAVIRPLVKVPEGKRRPLRKLSYVIQRLTPEVETVSASDTPDAEDAEAQRTYGKPPVEETEVEAPKKKYEPPADELEDAVNVYNDHLIAVCVIEWSFGAEVKLEAVADLPGDAYEAIITAIRDWNVEVAQADDDEDELDPTQPSSASSAP